MKIDLIKGQYQPDQIKKIMQVAFEAGLASLDLPERDRLQMVTQHEDYELNFLDVGLGYERTKKVLFFTIVTSPRTIKAKKAFTKKLVDELEKQLTVQPEDVLITFVNNHAEDWSFGLGKNQFLDGEL